MDKRKDNLLQKTEEERSLRGTVRGRERKSIDYILKGDSLLRTKIEGRIWMTRAGDGRWKISEGNSKRKRKGVA